MRDTDPTDAYLNTVHRMEADIHPVDLPTAAASIAISLVRIADTLDRFYAMAKAEVDMLAGQPDEPDGK